jgi:hypothetical protein
MTNAGVVSAARRWIGQTIGQRPMPQLRRMLVAFAYSNVGVGPHLGRNLDLFTG